MERMVDSEKILMAKKILVPVVGASQAIDGDV